MGWVKINTIRKIIIEKEYPAMSSFNIDPTFSVYRLIERVKKEASSVNHRKTMTAISYEIENATLLDNAKTTLFSGFQRMSRFLPQVARYEKIAKKAHAVFVFGVMDIVPPAIENVRYVPLAPTDQLTKEWFLVSLGEKYASALATEELTHIDDPDETRVFKGIWTFEHGMVEILHDWLTQTVGWRTDLEHVKYNRDHQIYYISQTIARMQDRLYRWSGTARADLSQEIAWLIQENLHRAYKALSPEKAP